MPSVSSTGPVNGIVWTMDNGNYCTPQSPGYRLTYDATNIATELWNSRQETGSAAGNAVKSTVPTIGSGNVYIGSRGNNTRGNTSSSTIPGESKYVLLQN